MHICFLKHPVGQKHVTVFVVLELDFFFISILIFQWTHCNMFAGFWSSRRVFKLLYLLLQEYVSCLSPHLLCNYREIKKCGGSPDWNGWFWMWNEYNLFRDPVMTSITSLQVLCFFFSLQDVVTLTTSSHQVGGGPLV